MKKSEIPKEKVNLFSLVAELEIEEICKALAKSRGNKNVAAKLLTLNRTTLLSKMRHYGMVLKKPHRRQI